MSKKALDNAKNAKYDEFYTQFNDIGNEVLSYDLDQFRDKVVLCPCDDPTESNFTLFFAKNFKRLGLRKLISTGYKKDGHGKKYELTGDTNGDGVINQHDIVATDLEGDGDFNSDEVKALRDEADIICTNPPFSLFVEFVKWINPDEKKFIILGNKNAISYKYIWELIYKGKCWLGARKMGIDTYFSITDSYKSKLLKSNRPSAYKVIDGNVLARVPSVWFTNLDHRVRHTVFSTMSKEVNELSGVTYSKYDNYDAIDIPETKLLPSDYDGVMGVPISFLDKYNPDQFELVGMFTGGNGVGFIPGSATPIASGKYTTAPVINKQKVYARILIKNK